MCPRPSNTRLGVGGVLAAPRSVAGEELRGERATYSEPVDRPICDGAPLAGDGACRRGS
ncbi:MAG TPA: hypothetical protein VL069_10880 [Opitutus sp.]|nr:hypothetical protein [Opitutus sp.]